MGCFRIEWRRSARKDLRRIPASDIQRILAIVESLAENPFPTGCVKLSGSERAWRVRMGDYRVIYGVHDEVLVVEIIKVGQRGDVYR